MNLTVYEQDWGTALEFEWHWHPLCVVTRRHFSILAPLQQHPWSFLLIMRTSAFDTYAQVAASKRSVSYTLSNTHTLTIHTYIHTYIQNHAYIYIHTYIDVYNSVILICEIIPHLSHYNATLSLFWRVLGLLLP